MKGFTMGKLDGDGRGYFGWEVPEHGQSVKARSEGNKVFIEVEVESEDEAEALLMSLPTSPS